MRDSRSGSEVAGSTATSDWISLAIGCSIAASPLASGPGSVVVLVVIVVENASHGPRISGSRHVPAADARRVDLVGREGRRPGYSFKMKYPPIILKEHDGATRRPSRSGKPGDHVVVERDEASRGAR